MMRSFTDHKKHAHTLDLDAVLVDGARCVSVQATEQSVQFELENQDAITCELGQFWHEVAGPELSAQEAGLLLADCLMRQVVLQRMSASMHEAMCVLTRAAALAAEIPSATWLTTRLDPLAHQALNAYDGSDAMTEMLARILHQSCETIHHWARQLGLNAPAPAEEGMVPPLEKETGPLVASAPVQGEAEARKSFRWTLERCQQLEEALSACPATTVSERARQIASEHDWPVQAVRSKLYGMQRPRRTGQPAARESEAPAEKEGDQRADQLEAAPM